MRCLLVTACMAYMSVGCFANDLTDQEFESAAREYRIYVYETYRTQRSEYDQRIEAAKQVSKTWKSLGDPMQQQVAYDWFSQARDAGVAPELPSFVANPDLVIRKAPKISRDRQQVASTNRSDANIQTASTPSTPATMPRFNPEPTPEVTEAPSKPNFFSALTSALISKPKRNASAVSADSEGATSLDVSAEVDDDSPFVIADDTEGSEMATAEIVTEEIAEDTTDWMLSDQIANFNTALDGFNFQLEDQATLTFVTLDETVDALEEMSAEYVGIKAGRDAASEDEQLALPELSSLESVLHLAIERTRAPESWAEGTLDSDQQASLAELESRLLVLLGELE